MRRRGQWRRGFLQRLGKFDVKVKQALTNRHVLWMHAVSVGEMNVCVELIRALEPRLPNIKIVVSTTTTTGMGELQKKLSARVSKIYYPLDFSSCVRRALATIHPDAIVLVEAEIWPNFIWRARLRGIPLFLVNARLSDRSYPRYKRFDFLFRNLFASFTAVGAQNEAAANRLRQVGCPTERVQVLGNLKFDTAKLNADKSLEVPALLAQLGVPGDALLWVAGSTHEGEEDLLAELFLRLRVSFPRLFLVIVPRHFERSKEVARQLGQRGIKWFYRTEITPETRLAPGSVECLLVDTTGELMSFYEHAGVAFVGKSLAAHGGQNPIEPAALGKATVFGPNMENFADVARIFVARDAAVQVRDKADLEKVMADLLANQARREELGRNARQVVLENVGAIDRTVDLIIRHFEGGEFYIVPRKTDA
jgi:3-deoxy-D-manno-octulosonic-acid transferase